MTFNCKRCGKCCGFVPFSKEEFANIQKEAKELGIAFEKVSFGNRESYFPKELLKIFMSITPQTPNEEVQKKIDMLTCPFLEKDAMGICSCKIYDKRPKVCRLFGSAIHPTLICPNNRSAKDD